MAARGILELGHPLLREVSREVTDFASIRELFDDLRDTLAVFRQVHGFGRGIAAIQIGVPLRAIFIRIGNEEWQIANPRISWASDAKLTLWDDCFSFPQLMVQLQRHAGIAVAYQDAQGQPRNLLAEGDMSELLQHEIDHLDGILAIDHVLDPRTGFRTRQEHLRQTLR